MTPRALFTCLALALAACDDGPADSTPDMASGPTPDAMADAMLDAMDGTPDDSPDAMPDGTPDATADATADAAPPADPAFTLDGIGPADCPLSAADCAEIWPAAGSVDLLRSTERFGDAEHPRTAWLYRPPETDGRPLPLLVFLHGGTGNGAAMFARQFDELARGDAIEWRRGDEDCFYTHPTGFADADGRRCLASAQTYRGIEPFALLLPDGIRSISTRIEGARHWEDGRSPSPGQLVDEETRDDVGYIAHLVDLARARDDIDPDRIYLAGWSNGGMMTQRIVCEMGRPGREPLRHIAAVAIGIASMPVNLYDGALGRPQCPRDGFEPPSMMFQVGRGIDTPDCEPYPCAMPVADGDGRMPYASHGERHRTYSPDGGHVVSFPETRDLFAGALDAAYGNRFDEDAPIGLFTAVSVSTFDARVELRVLVTDGGAHDIGGVRGEFASEGRQWQFLSRFHRVAGRVEQRRAGSVEGDY